VFLHELTYESALPVSLQQALANDKSAVDHEIFDMGLDSNADDWITASEDDGECDDVIDDLRGTHRDADIQSVILLLSGAHLTRSPVFSGVMGGLKCNAKLTGPST